MAASPLRFHHLGYVVSSIETAMPGFVRSLLVTWDGRVVEDPLQKVRVAFLSTRPEAPLVELVEPVGADSPGLRFLQEKGGGMHHVCYEVADLEQELAGLRARGAALAKRPKPAVAFGGRRIAWVITAEKLLVELLEERLQEGRP